MCMHTSMHTQVMSTHILNMPIIGQHCPVIIIIIIIINHFYRAQITIKSLSALIEGKIKNRQIRTHRKAGRGKEIKKHIIKYNSLRNSENYFTNK